jgi:phytoene dehydrogenase-like protein
MILVVGAGLAGLRAALTIQESGAQVHLVEAASEAGGRVTSSSYEGFTIDRGFQVINPGYTEFQRLDLRTLIHPIPAGAVANISNQWNFFGDPRRELRASLGALPHVLANPLPFLGLIRAVLLSTVRAGESADAFLHRNGISGETYDALVEPFLRGVFLTSLSEVDARFAKRVLRSLYRRVPGLPDGGVQAIANELRYRLKSFQSGEPVESISRTGKGFTVRTPSAVFSARKVIIATDYFNARRFAPSSEGFLPAISFAHSYAWYFTVEEPLPRAHQLHVLQLGSGPVVTSVDLSKVVSSYSPDGRGLLSVTTLEECSESEVRSHLAAIYGSELCGELLTRFKISNALPIIAPGARRAGVIEDEGLIFAGDYLTEPSQNGALLSGRIAAERALKTD